MMLKVLSALSLLVLLSACGVDTSSSPYYATTNTDGSTGTTDDNTDGSDGNTTDTTGTNTDGSTDVNCTDDTVFECTSAEYDASACNAGSYNIASDASYDGVSLGENGSDFFSIPDAGLEIKSEHLEGSASYNDRTWVTLFYKSFPDFTQLGIQGYTSYLMDGVFYLTYDIAWSDESIPGIDNTVYVQSNKDDKPVCYRLVLNSTDGSQIEVQKVFR